ARGLPAARRRREQELRAGARGLLLRLPDALPRVRAAVPRLVPARRRVAGGDGAADRHAAAADPARVTGVADKRSAPAEGTERLGAALAPWLKAGDVVVLSGPLGAGKTRLVAGIVRALSPGARVRSPSFTLMGEFGGPVPVFHLDLYRLDDERDVEDLGL